MRRTLAVVVLLAAGLAGCGGATPHASSTRVLRMQTFTSAAYRFSIAYDPRRLTRVNDEADSNPTGRPSQLVVDFLAGTRPAQNQRPLEGLRVVAVHYEHAVTQSLAHPRLLPPGFVLHSVRAVTLNGLPGYRYQFSWRLARGTDYQLFHGHFTYELLAQASPQAWRSLGPSLARAIRSFRTIH
jgi:hypothetical protein